MKYTVRNRRRLRPATGEYVRATAHAPEAPEALGVPPAPVAEGSGLHRRPLVTEINLTIPFEGRLVR